MYVNKKAYILKRNKMNKIKTLLKTLCSFKWNEYQVLINRALFLLYTFFELRFTKKIKLEYIGDEEGWFVPINLINDKSIVYSLGAGLDISFDLNLIEKTKCNVFLFDPTPHAVKYVNQFLNNKYLHFFQQAISNKNEKLKLYMPNKIDGNWKSEKIKDTNKWVEFDATTVKNAMITNKHKNITMLKVDIEGAEYEVIPNIFNDNIFPHILSIDFDQPVSIFKSIKLIHLIKSHNYILIKRNVFDFTFLRK